MADDDSSQEKTEEPTGKKLEKAREEGQVPRSRDLTTSGILLAGTVGLFVLGQFISTRLADNMRFNFELDRETIFDPDLMIGHLTASFYDGMVMLVPFFIIMLVASIVGPIALGGWLWSTKALMPKASRMDPIKGLGRMFGLKALVELGKALGKVLVVIFLAIWLLMYLQEDMLALANQDVVTGIVNSLKISGWAAIALAASTLLIAAVDVPWQIYEHTKKLKMSLQDIKDEHKDTEGKPEVKGRIRQLQREMANNRMMAEVPEADVVITNPTHYAVALKYDPENMSTPMMVAKGGDFIALKIREIAVANDVEIVESPMLARAIYHTTDIDDEIPGGLYVAVAQVLAYVFQLRNYRRGEGEKPPYPSNVTVPYDMRYE